MKIYAMSDQHGYFPDVPECDLLIVAGDLIPPNLERNAGAQKAWFLQKWQAWRAAQPAKLCLVTWGNHDTFGAETEVHTDNDSTRIVVDGLVEFEGLKIWLTPWSRTYGGGVFMTDEARLGSQHYTLIPDGIDILVSHTPPYGFSDDLKGSFALLHAIERVKPQVVICGHIHEGVGESRMYHDDGWVTHIYNVTTVIGGWRQHPNNEFRPPVEINL